MSTAVAVTGSVRRAGLRITARWIQIGLGVVWVVDGLLQLQPHMFGTDFANNVIMPSAMGQPGVVSSVISHMAHLISVQPAPADVVFAGVQLLIGLGLLIRETVKPALALSFVWALGVWSLGEGFGGLLSGTALPLTGAPGAALLYIAAGLMVWPRRGGGMVVGSGGPAAAEGRLGERGGKAIWALVWCGLGILWFLPASTSSGALSNALADAAGSGSGVLSHVQLSLAHDLAGGGTAVAVMAGLLSLAIGLGPLLTRGRPTVFLVAGVAVSLDCWVFGQSFGQLSSGLATDLNTGPLLVLLALALWPARTEHGTRALRNVADVVPPTAPFALPVRVPPAMAVTAPVALPAAVAVAATRPRSET